MSKKTVTRKAGDIIKVGMKTGDKLMDQFNSGKDLKVVQTSLMAYKMSISAAKAQLIHKKLTGMPESIAFFED